MIFSTSYFPLVGGAEVAVKEITDRLPEIEFDLITAKQHKNFQDVERIGNVTVYRLGFGYVTLDKLLVPYWGALKALKLNKEKHYAAFWCIMATFASGAAYIANWFQKKVPVILTLQEGDSEEHLTFRWGGLLNLSWKLALKRTDFLTAISTYLSDRAKRFGFKGKSFIIPNGVDVNKFNNVKHRVFDKDSVTLITTSRLVKKNAVGDIIEALKFLPNAKLKILGVGPLEQELKSLAVGLPVEFLGIVSQDEIPKYLHNADIFVRPSLSEGQGISFIEAMAAGLPVIATPVGGIIDFLRDGETGIFCEINNPESIAKQIKRLIGSPDLRQKLVENAQKMVKEKYEWDLIARQMKAIFDTLPA